MADFLTMQRAVCLSATILASGNKQQTQITVHYTIQGAANCKLLQMQITHNLTKIGCGCDSDYAVYIVCET